MGSGAARAKSAGLRLGDIAQQLKFAPGRSRRSRRTTSACPSGRSRAEWCAPTRALLGLEPGPLLDARRARSPRRRRPSARTIAGAHPDRARRSAIRFPRAPRRAWSSPAAWPFVVSPPPLAGSRGARAVPGARRAEGGPAGSPQASRSRTWPRAGRRPGAEVQPAKRPGRGTAARVEPAAGPRASVPAAPKPGAGEARGNSDRPPGAGPAHPRRPTAWCRFKGPAWIEIKDAAACSVAVNRGGARPWSGAAAPDPHLGNPPTCIMLAQRPPRRSHAAREVRRGPLHHSMNRRRSRAAFGSAT